MNTAYSYIRFSSKPQEWGDSERRQEQAAKDYCHRKGLTLSEKGYADRGVSAKAGRNRASGSAFAELLKIVKPADYILIEDNDRFSREDPITALAELKRILSQKDITVVFMSTGVEVTKHNFNQPSVLFPNFFKGYLGYSENVKKGERLKEAWAERQRQIMEGKDRFGKLPFWLKRDKLTGVILVVREAAEVVRMIYSLCDKGKGIRGIVEQLNRNKTPLFRSNSERGYWVSSTVQFVLRTPTVFGAFQNHKKDENGKRQPVGPLAENVLPVIIPKETALRIWDKISARPKISGRYDPKRVNNLLTGIARCAYCGASMVFSRKGRHNYLTCADFHFSHTCQPGVLNYDIIEKVLFKFINTTVKASETSVIPDGITDTALSTLHDNLANVRASIKRAVKLYTLTEAQEALDEVQELKRKEKAITADLATYESDQRAILAFPKEFKELTLVFAQGADRLLLREKLRSVVRHIEVDAKGMKFSVAWASGRPADILELKQTFRGCKPAAWSYRFKCGAKVEAFSQWLPVVFSTVKYVGHNGELVTEIIEPLEVTFSREKPA